MTVVSEVHTDTSLWDTYATMALQGKRLSPTQALSVLQADDRQLLSLLHAAYRVRYFYYGNKVKLNVIMNAKSGLCPEDCGYCAQSIVSTAPISKYPLLDRQTIIDGAKRALERQVGTYCIVASGRGPTNRDLEHVIEAVAEIKATMPLKICACLGILNDDQAVRLKQAGVDRYNHNLNTDASHFSNITTTHTYDDRVRTVETATRAGMSPCSGCIVGMGETDAQLVDVAFALRDLHADSIPVNFLHAIAGTPLEHVDVLNPRRCLKILALMRFVCPTKEIRASGGREVNLRSLQPLALYAANSIFIGDYLTTAGQAYTADHQMIADMGFEIETCAL